MSDNSSNNKRIAKNTIILYFRMFITLGVSLFTSRVVLHTLGVDDYGIYNVVAGFVTMFTFINSAMSNATQRYITIALGKGNEHNLSKNFCMSLNIHFLISVIFLLFAETLGVWFLNTHMTIPADRIVAANWVFQFAIISTVIMMISVPYNALIVAHERMSAFAYVSILDVMLKLVIVYALYLTGFDKLIVYALLMCMVQVLLRVIYGWYCGKHFKESQYKWIFDKTLFREMLGFSGWSLFGNLASIASDQGVNVLLNMVFGPAVNAARGIAMQVQNAINGFAGNFQMALNPQITKNYAINNLTQMHTLVYVSSKYSFYLLWILSLPILLTADSLLEVWLVETPEHSVNFLRISLIIIIVNAMASPLTVSAQANGNIRRYQFIVGGIMLFIIPASYLALKLIPIPELVFVITLMTIVLAQLFRLYMMRTMIHLSIREYITKVIVPIATVCLSSIILPFGLFLILDTSFVSAIMICFCSVISVALCVYLFGLGCEEKMFVQTKVKQILNKVV